MKAEKILWILFTIITVLMVGRAIAVYRGFDFQKIDAIYLLLMVLMFFVYCMHSISILTAKKAIIFFTIASAIGFFFEYLGVTYGLAFGGLYVYDDSFLKIFGIPFVIPAFWAVFAYMSFTIVDSFFVWIGKKTPIINRKNISLLLPICIADGLIAMSMDLLMDPFQVKSGFWHWKNGGPYFNVPIGNFTGWVLVIAIITGIFRLYELKNPIRNTNVPKNLYLLILFSYAIFCMFYMIIAPKFEMRILSMIGVIPLIIVGINIYLYKRHQ